MFIIMKKVFVTFAVVAMMFAAVSCGNKNAKKAEPAEPAATEQAAPAPKEENAVKAAAEQAATDVAVEAINAAADKAKEEIKK